MGGGGTKNSFQLAIFHLKVCFALSCIKVKSIKIKLWYILEFHPLVVQYTK